MIEVLFAVIISQLGWELKQNVREFLWDYRGTILHWVWVLACAVVPYVFRTSVMQVLRHVVLPAAHALALEWWETIECMGLSAYRYIVFAYNKRRRMRRIVNESSGRTQRVLDLLDLDELGGDEMELIARRQYVRCAVLISRRARQGLKYPKHSAANERIAADWILKHLPDDMTMGVRHKVLPLAVKLTFVRSHHEVRADYHFTLLNDMVEKA